MSDTKFTKGEWGIFDGDSHSKEVRITTEKREGSLTVPICELDVHFSGDIGFEQVANMHLIAAAPEMYAMLERVKTVLLRTYDVTDYPADGNTDCDIYAAKIEELLAKARGE